MTQLFSLVQHSYLPVAVSEPQYPTSPPSYADGNEGLHSCSVLVSSLSLPTVVDNALKSGDWADNWDHRLMMKISVSGNQQLLKIAPTSWHKSVGMKAEVGEKVILT